MNGLRLNPDEILLLASGLGSLVGRTRHQPTQDAARALGLKLATAWTVTHVVTEPTLEPTLSPTDRSLLTALGVRW